MAEIFDAPFNQDDSLNQTGTHPSWNGSALPSTIDNAGRALQGALRREWAWRNPTLTSTGSSNAYVLTYPVSPGSLGTGQSWAFKANFTNTGPSTAQINALGAKAIKKLVAGVKTDLASGDIVSGHYVFTIYDGVDFILLGVVSHTHLVADLSDASAGAKTFLQAASFALMRAALGLGTAAVLDVGTAASNIPQLDGTGKILSSVLPTVTGTRTLLSTQTAAASATLDFALPGGYSRYEFEFDSLIPATNSVDLYVRVSIAAAYRSTSGDYQAAFNGTTTSPTTAINLGINGTVTMSNTGTGISGIMSLLDAHSTTKKKPFIVTTSWDRGGGSSYGVAGGGQFIFSNAALDGVRFLMSSGNITSGVVRMYGYAT